MATTTTTPRIRITSEGNVGIGTNAPLQRLHVSGNVTVDAESAYRIGNVDTFNEARMQEEIEFQRALRPYACDVQVPDTELLPFFGAPTAPSYFTTTLEQYIEDTAPHDLFCPVGHCLMYEAVVSEGDGELYERKNLELHIAFAEINDRELYSPLTNMPMEAGFVPCNFMRRAVREHVKIATRKWEELEDALWTEQFVQKNAAVPKAGDNHSREGANTDEIMRNLLQRRVQAQNCQIRFLLILIILSAIIFAVLTHTI